MADPYQLQQVFVNLANNACQAMHKAHSGGHLTVITELEPATSSSQRASVQPTIRVTIQDDGPGIPDYLLSSIFDPFFTTKPEGQGTGLGLAVCHGIVSEHGGDIWAESEPDHGATFFVELPVVPPEASHRAGVRHRSDHVRTTVSDTPACQNGDRVLVIDDEEDLLGFLSRALQREGYRVDAVSDGEIALAHLADTDYKLIICDIRMPGLSGPEIFRRVQQRDPASARRFMFITGDTVGVGTQRFLDEAGVAYLCKPFGLADFISHLHALQEPPANGSPAT